MSTTVSMPQLGETVTEGTILRWAKKVGDEIAEDEVLLEISTDKVDTEVPSPVAGTVLQILVDEGETVGVGVDLVVIGDSSEQSAEQTDQDDFGADQGVPEESTDAEVEPVVSTGSTETSEEEPEQPEGDASEEPKEPEEPRQPEEDSAEESRPSAGDGELHPASETPAGPDTGFEAAAVFSESAEASGDSTDKQGVHEAQLSDDEVEAFFTQPSPEGKPQLLSPVVRRLVRENEVDLGQIEGSGQGGRITRRDVEAYLTEREPTPRPVEPEPAMAADTPEPVAARAATPSAEPAEDEAAPEAAAEEEETVPTAGTEEGEVELDRIRVRIAENMIKARQTAAHVWTSVEVDFERVERVRQSRKSAFKESEGFSLTYLPFISRATIDALNAFPVVNSSFDLENKTSVFHKKVDLGIAIDLDQGGLVVARVRNADGLRLVGIAREIKELAEKARRGKLGLDDLTGSTFTITNPGPFGSFMSAPIINVPNVAILSTDTVAKRPTVVTSADGQDMIAIRHIGYLGLSWDHRAFDGSTAVLFLRRIKENLETWDWDQELA